MSQPETVFEYLQEYSGELGQRILEQFPALHPVGASISPLVRTLLRRPFAAQSTVLMGLVRAWQEGARNTIVLGEMGTGKTLMSLGAVHVHSERKPYTALAMVPPHLVNKWAREALKTIPRMRVFMIDGFRDASSKSPNGIHEVRLRRGGIVRDGLSTTLSELRLRGTAKNAYQRWLDRVRQPSLFVIGKETAKLGPAWKHVYRIAKSGSNRGRLVNPESGNVLFKANGDRLTAEDFTDFKRSEILEHSGEHPIRKRHSALWQVDNTGFRRTAPVDFFGRYMHEFFDYTVCDELHQLAHVTAQGNALGVLASCSKRLLGLTGSLVDGYAGHLFNILFRLFPGGMREAGYDFSPRGLASFIDEFGVLEQIETTSPKDNQTSEARTTTRVRERPGASPRLFGNFLLPHCAFIFLKDIADQLPPFSESIVSVQMEGDQLKGYRGLEEEARAALKANLGNRSVMSKIMHSLLLYPNHPFDFGTIYATRWDKELRRKVLFSVATPVDCPKSALYPKERSLIDDIRRELADGRRCQIYAVYGKTQQRLKDVLERAGFRVAHLTTKIRPSEREAWYTRRVQEGYQVILAHPKLVETGLDLLDFPTFYFFETGHSVHLMRQASRRSYRIGQRLPVRVKYMVYAETAQDTCLELMGRKLLVALTTEGQFCGEGFQGAEEDESDILAAVARSLVKQDIGESAEQAWRTLRETEEALQSAGLISGSAGPVEQEPEEDDLEDVSRLPLPDLGLGGDSPVLVFGQRPTEFFPVRRRPRVEVAGQASLFDA